MSAKCKKEQGKKRSKCLRTCLLFFFTVRERKRSVLVQAALAFFSFRLPYSVLFALALALLPGGGGVPAPFLSGSENSIQSNAIGPVSCARSASFPRHLFVSDACAHLQEFKDGKLSGGCSLFFPFLIQNNTRCEVVIMRARRALAFFVR